MWTRNKPAIFLPIFNDNFENLNQMIFQMHIVLECTNKCMHVAKQRSQFYVNQKMSLRILDVGQKVFWEVMSETPWVQKRPEMTLAACSACGKRAQMIIAWVKAPCFGNAFHPQRLGVTSVRPSAMRSSWLVDSIMLKDTSIEGMSQETWQLEWDAISGQCLGIEATWKWFDHA